MTWDFSLDSGKCNHDVRPPLAAFGATTMTDRPSSSSSFLKSEFDRLPPNTLSAVLTRFISLDVKKLCGKTATPGSTGQNLPLHNSGASNSRDIKARSA